MWSLEHCSTDAVFGAFTSERDIARYGPGLVTSIALQESGSLIVLPELAVDEEETRQLYIRSDPE